MNKLLWYTLLFLAAVYLVLFVLTNTGVLPK